MPQGPETCTAHGPRASRIRDHCSARPPQRPAALGCPGRSARRTTLRRAQKQPQTLRASADITSRLRSHAEPATRASSSHAALFFTRKARALLLCLRGDGLPRLRRRFLRQSSERPPARTRLSSSGIGERATLLSPWDSAPQRHSSRAAAGTSRTTLEGCGPRSFMSPIAGWGVVREAVATVAHRRSAGVLTPVGPGRSAREGCTRQWVLGASQAGRITAFGTLIQVLRRLTAYSAALRHSPQKHASRTPLVW
ncbi:hypothetical protein BKA01_008523 [Pseudonocardia eucalypti]|nr:hypothetical protein [Pseudonocardia eucalypti]